MTTLTVTSSGHTVMADALARMSLCLAVGSGLAAWGETPPQIDQTVAALTTPFALVRPTAMQFMVPDENGTFEWIDGTLWRASTDITDTLLLSYRLGYQDAPNETVREYALVAGAVIAPEVPAGLKFIPWAQVITPGRYFAGHRCVPKPRAGSELFLDQLVGL